MSECAPAAHPTLETLRTFGLGQLAPQEASAVEEHVLNCETCCRALMEVQPDSLVGLLRAARQTTPGGAREPETLAVVRPAEDGARPAEEVFANSVNGGLPPELRDHPRYRVLELLGIGGMGAVFRAEHRLMKRHVALKILNPTLVSRSASVERFHREVQAAAHLTHPNIVAAYDAEQAGNLHLLVMEYVEGTDLARLVRERGMLPVAEACDYVRQTALGLQHAHEHGMIHRDVKPHNLMRTPEGQIKILDFGLARLAAERDTEHSGVTGQGTVLGTVDYMAPEQADNAREADIRSDIYSLGCTLYHLLSGRPPFPKGTLVQKIMAHTERQAQSLLELRPDLPGGLVKVVERMMAKEPASRYQTPAEVAVALEPFARQGIGLNPLPGRRAPVRTGRAAPTRADHQARKEARGEERPTPSIRRRRRWPIVLALLALLGGLVLFAGAIYRLQTDNGELIIQTDNPDVEVVIRQNGKIVRIIDTKTNKEITLTAGLYDLELKGQPDGLQLSLDRVTIRRGDTVVATISRKKRTAAVAAQVPPPPANPELLHSIAWQDESQGFPAHIYQTGISSDGRLFFGAGDAGFTGAVRVFDLVTGKQVQEFVIGEDTAGQVPYTFAQFLPGSKQIVVSYNIRKEPCLWDIPTGKLVRKFIGHTEPDVRFAVSPDGKRLLSWSDDKTLRLWDIESGKELRKLEGHSDKAAGVFSPDGKQILSFSPDKTLRLWDVDSGKELKKLEGHTDACTGIFSPDGKQALSWGPDQTIRLWDLATGKEVRRFEGPADRVGHAGFLAGGRQVVGRTEDKKFRLWETASGKLIGEIDGSKYGGDGWSLTATPDGRQAVVSVEEDGSVRVLELPSGKETHRYESCPKARAWSFSADGRVAVAGSFRAGLYVFRLPVPAPQEKTLQPPEKVGEARQFPQGHIAWSVSFSPDGRLLLTGGGQFLHLWDARTGQEVRKFEHGCWSATFSPDGKSILIGTAGPIELLDAVTGKVITQLEANAGRVRNVVFSPDGRQAASSHGDGQVRLWDLARGQELRAFPAHNDPVHSAVFTPDGKRLLVINPDSSLRLYDANSGAELRKFEGHTDKVFEVAISPDGRKAVSAGEDKTIRLWDVETGKEIRKLEGHTEAVHSVAFCPDGRRCLSGSVDRTVRLWDVETGKELHRFEGHTNSVVSVAVSPDGHHGLSGSVDETIRLWRLPAATAAPVEKAGELRQFKGHDEGIIQVALSPDGRLALSGSPDHTARLWDVATGKELHKLAGHTNQVYAVAFRPDGRQCLTGSEDNLIKLWDTATGKELRTFEGHTGIVTGVAFSPDGKQAMSSSWDNTLRLWDVETGKELRKFEGHPEGVQSVAFSPDGKRAASCSFDKTVRLWKVETGEEIRKFEGHTSMVRSVAYSPDGKRLLSGAWEEGTVRLWDVESGKELRQIHAIDGGVHGVSFSPDGRRGLVCGADKDVLLYDLQTGEIVCRLEGHTVPEGRVVGVVPSAVFSADGRHALSGSGDKTLRLWRLPGTPATPTTPAPEKVGLLRRFEGHKGDVRNVVFTPDGKYVLSASGTLQPTDQNDFTLRLWDVRTGKEVRRFEGHSGLVIGLAVSPDGKQALSSSWDRTVRLWDVATGKEVRRFEKELPEPECVAFAPDGKTALVGSGDAIMRLWDVETGKEVRIFEGHTDKVRSVAFSPDGKTALSGSFDRTAILWDVASGKRVRTFEGQEERVSVVLFAPGGKEAVIGTHGSTLRLWDLETGKEVRKFAASEGQTEGAAIAAGRLAASGGGDRTLHVWDLGTGQQLCSFQGHEGWMSGVAISPDGRYAASGGGDGIVWLWRLPDRAH